MGGSTLVMHAIESRGYTVKEFFAFDDAIFFSKLPCCQHTAKVARVATLALMMRQLKNQKKSQEIQHAEFFMTKYKLVTSHMEGWLHMRFSSALAT